MTWGELAELLAWIQWTMLDITERGGFIVAISVGSKLHWADE